MTRSQFWRGAIAITVLVIIAKSIAALREVLLAAKYGTDSLIDGYYFTLGIALWPIAVWTGIASATLIPISLQNKGHSKSDIVWRSELLGASIALGAILSVSFYATFELLTNTFSSGLNSSALTSANACVIPMAAMVFFATISASLSAWLIADGKIYSTLTDALPPLGCCTSLFATKDPSIELIAWGTAIGGIAQCLVLSIKLRHHNRVSLPSFRFTSPSWKPLIIGTLSLVIGQFIMSGTSVADQFYAAKLDPGSISALNFSNKLLAVITGIGGLAISRIFLPQICNQTQTEAPRRPRWIASIFLLSIAGSTIIALESQNIVSIAFERGAFNATDANIVSRTFLWGLVQIPFYFAGQYLAAMAAAKQKLHILTFAAIPAVLIKFSILYFTFNHADIIIVPISTAAMFTVSFFSVLILTTHTGKKNGTLPNK